MKVYRLIIILVILILITSACNLSKPAQDDLGDSNELVPVETSPPEILPPTEDVKPTTAVDEEADNTSTRLVTFDQLGVSLEIPAELYVYKNPQFNYDDPSKLDSYLFYIQNYGYPGGSPSGDFQMYGILQYSLWSKTWEEFKENTLNSPMNAYAFEIDVNGLRGFDTQGSGERPRFVYQFLVNGQVLYLAVSAPTEENKALADQIVSTLQYVPEKFNNISHIQKIIEPNGFYQMYIPDDWDFTFIAPANIQLSGLEASSPDAEVVGEVVDGPHDNIYYKQGVLLNFVIMDDDSALREPMMGGIKSSNQVMYNGIEMTDYVFIGPSTVEGEHRELRFFHNGLSYSLTFSYAEGVDQDQIEWIIRNIEIQE
jgi:hypothetical protein